MSETGEILYFGVEGFLKAAPKDKEGKYQVKNLPSSRKEKKIKIRYQFLGYEGSRPEFHSLLRHRH